MIARRPWQVLRHSAAALRTILACLLLTTCSADSMSPGGSVATALDLTSLLRAPGDLPIPIDEVIVELRRTADSSLAESRTIAINPANQSDTALRVSIAVEMNRDEEDFYLKVQARGNGVLYFVVESIVTARRNRSSTTPALTPVYVGPGANADALSLGFQDSEVEAGDSVLITATAFENDVEVPGVPVGFSSSDPTRLRVRQLGLNQAWAIAPVTATEGTVTITAVGPNQLTTTNQFDVFGGTPATLHLQATSAVNQNGVVNQLVSQPPTVQVFDANNAPVPNATVTFLISDGGGTIADSVQTSDAEGTAQLGSWRLGTSTSTYVVQATMPGANPIEFFAQGTPTTLASLFRVSGDSQTAATSTALPQPLVIEARDTFANTITSGTVNWTATDGTITPTSPVNASGQAQATWTLGSTQAQPTATATLGGVTTIFSATTTFPNPTVQLAFSSIPGVGVGLTSRVRVTLTAAAPAGGTVVSLSSGAPATFTVPATVTIAAGQTSDSVLVTGVAVGNALLTGSASGYVSGTLTVDVQLRNLNPPVTINVPFGQNASLPISIPSPAPAGGITIAVATSAPTLVGVATPTVTIAAGATTTNATLQGLLPGVATITLTNPAYNSGTTTATTAASLNFAPTTLSINASFGAPLDVDFVSNSVPIAAPTPGVTVTSVVAVPSCVQVTPSPATIATGLTTVTLTFSYTGTATLPCSSKVVVSAPNIQPDSVTVSVSAVPQINTNNATIAAGLMNNTNFSLGASNHGGVTVSVVSLNPAIAIPATSLATLPADSIGIPIANGGSSFNPVFHGVAPGTATLVAKAPGFVTDTFVVTVVAPALDLSGVLAATTTFSPNDVFNVRVGVPNAGNTSMTTVMPVRFGQPALIATITSGTPATGVLVTATDPGAALVTVQIPAGASSSGNSVATGGVELDPLAAGTTSVSATIPGLIALTTATAAVTVSAPVINANPATVAANLQSQQQFGTLGATNHGGVTVWIKTTNAAVMLVSPNALTAGTDSISIPLLNGSNQFTYYVQGTGGQIGTANLVVSAAGFIPDTNLITVPQVSYDLSGLVTTTSNLSANDAFSVRIGIGNAAAVTTIQEVRPGGTPIVATITNTNAAVADLATSADTADVVTVTIPVGSGTSLNLTNGGVEFDPVAGGTTTVTASIPGLLSTTNASQAVTVTSTGITLSAATIGSGLMTSGNGSLGGSAQHGGVTVVVRSENPAVARIALNSTTAAADSLVFNLPNGTVAFNFVVHGMDGIVGSDSTLFTAYATGYNTQTAMMRVPQAGIDISGLPTTINTSAANDNFAVRVGIPFNGNGGLSTVQARRFGGATLVATVTNSNVPIADLISGSGPSDQVTVTIPAGSSSSGAIAAGGADFDPIAAGSTTVSATMPGYIATTPASVAVTISAPIITVNSGTVGAGLMVGVNGALASGIHPTDSITLTSSQPSVLLLAPNTNTAATASIRLQVASGATGFSFVMVGVEGQTGTAVVTGQFPGFTDGTSTGDVRAAGIDLSGVPTTTTALTADDPFIARIGWTNTGNGSLGAVQSRRFGAAPLTITMTSSNAAVGRVKTATDSGATATVQILAGQSSSPGTVATGGVSFDPLTAGATTVAGTAPGIISTTPATVSVTVTTPTITTFAQTVGGGLQTGTLNGSLNAPVPAGGLTVTLTSANPSVVLLSPDNVTAGVGQITIPLVAGATSFNYVVSAPFGVTGTANVTAALPGYTGDVKLITVVQPGLEVSGITGSQSAGAANDEFVIRIGIPNALNTGIQTFQQTRFGGPVHTVTVSNSNATVGQLVTTAGAGQSRPVDINIGANQTPATVSIGGVSFDGLTAGSTVVSATIPGFVVLPSSSFTVTVTP